MGVSTGGRGIISTFFKKDPNLSKLTPYEISIITVENCINILKHGLYKIQINLINMINNI